MKHNIPYPVGLHLHPTLYILLSYINVFLNRIFIQDYSYLYLNYDSNQFAVSNTNANIWNVMKLIQSSNIKFLTLLRYWARILIVTKVR